MNRETIERAAIETARKACAHFDEAFEYANGFVTGADWRINSVWNDGTVSCQTRRKALVLFKNGNAEVYNDLRDLSFERMWGEVERFAYIDDLLPDRKEADQ